MSSRLLESGLHALTFARGVTMKLLEDLSDDQCFHQPLAGANHAAWFMGHMAHTDDDFLNVMAGKPSGLPEDWGKTFAMKSVPQPDPRAYPPLDRIRDAMMSTREALLARFRSMSDEQLLAPLPKGYDTFAPTHAALMGAVAWHEGLHAGQLTLARKALGFGPKFG